MGTRPTAREHPHAGSDQTAPSSPSAPADAIATARHPRRQALEGNPEEPAGHVAGTSICPKYVRLPSLQQAMPHPLRRPANDIMPGRDWCGRLRRSSKHGEHAGQRGTEHCSTVSCLLRSSWPMPYTHEELSRPEIVPPRKATDYLVMTCDRLFLSVLVLG